MPPEQNYFEQFGDNYNATPPQQPEDVSPSAVEPDNYFSQFGDNYQRKQPSSSNIEDEDPTWGDYGRMVMSGGAQIGAGIGWLANGFDWGKGLQKAGTETAEAWMENLSPQAKAALQVEFTSRDRGDLWTDAKWNKAKLTAMQSLLGTMAGMGVGSVLTKGLGAAGMSAGVTTATGLTVQAPSKVAGAIGYGLGEASIAAPSVGASVESEIMGMTHEDLYANAADYQAIYDALENDDPTAREQRAKKILAGAAAGDASLLALASTFILSAPFGNMMAKMTAGLPLTTGGGRLAGAGRGALGEAGQEFLQSGAEKMAENIGVRQADPSRGITEGALEESVGGALAGSLMGGGVGAAANPAQAPIGPPLDDADSPLAALAEGGEPPPGSAPPGSAPPGMGPDVNALPDKDELDDALEQAYNELGIATVESEARAAEQAWADSIVAEEEATVQAEKDQLDKDKKDLERARVDIEMQEMESAQERNRERIAAEEQERREQDQAKRDTAFAQAEKGDAKAARREEREREKGFGALEQAKRDEEYERELAVGEAAGVGVGRAKGEMLGEKIQGAQQDAEGEPARLKVRPGTAGQNFSYEGNKFEIEVHQKHNRDDFSVDVSTKDSSTTSGFIYRKDMSREFDTLAEAKTYAEEMAAKDTNPTSSAAPITKGAPAVGVPDPEFEYIDERLRDPASRGRLEGLKADLLYKGGSTLIPDDEAPGYDPEDPSTHTTFKSRTKSLNPDWYQSMAADGMMTSVPWFKNAVDKALAGKRLQVKQKRAIQGALDVIDGQDEESGGMRLATSKRGGEDLFGMDNDTEAQRKHDEKLAAKEKQADKDADKAERSKLPADLGIKGDLFTTQTDLVDETEKATKKQKSGGRTQSAMHKPAVTKTGETVTDENGDSITEGEARLRKIQKRHDKFTKVGKDVPASQRALLSNGWMIGDPFDAARHTMRLALKEGNTEVYEVALAKAERSNEITDAEIAFLQAAKTENDLSVESGDLLENDETQYALERELDGVVPEKPAKPKKSRKKASTAEPDEQQADLVDVTTKAANKERGVPEGKRLIEQKPSELNALVAEVEKEIERFIQKGETSGMDETSIVAGVQKLKVHGHPRAAELEQIARDAIEGKGKKPAKKKAKAPEEAPVKGREQFEMGGSTYEVEYEPGITTVWRKVSKAEQKKLTSPMDQSRPGWAHVSSRAGAYKRGLTIANAARGVPDKFVIDEKKFMEEGPDTNARVFESSVPKNRKGIDIRLKNEGNEFISMEQADGIVTEWEDHAIQQGKDSRKARDHKDNFNRVIISLFDTTGTWANPYALAGYDVRTLDIKDGIDITDFSTQFMDEAFNNFEGKEIYGILAACPCTTFSNSSTKWRKKGDPKDPRNRHENDDPEMSRYWIEKMWGKEAAEAKNEDGTPTYATAHEYAISLVDKTMQTLEYLRPKFWALENPEGRIEKAAGLPGRWRTGFQPHNFGEPHSKRTLLWGEFDENLPTANVEPTEGSKMHLMSPSEDRAAERSETPVGFSYAFFMANNYLDTSPLERTKADYWYVEGAIEEAFRAGITEDQIRENVYLDEAFEPEDVEGTRDAIRELIEKGPPPAPTPDEDLFEFVAEGMAQDPMKSEISPESRQAKTVFDRIEKELDKGKSGQQMIDEDELDLEGYLGNNPNAEGWEVVGESDDDFNSMVWKKGNKQIRMSGYGQPQDEMELSWYTTDKKNSVVELTESEQAALEAIPDATETAEDESVEVGEIPGWEDIEAEAASSPDNDRPVPTDAQIEAGNYKMAHITIKRMPISIENSAADESRGGSEHYGKFDGIKGADNEDLDVFVNPKIQTDYQGSVYVIDQMDQKTGQFDEHKVMLGYTNQLAAVKAYKNSYDKGWKVGPITTMEMGTFKKWTQSRAKLTRPASEDSFFGEQSRLSGRASKGKTPDLENVGRGYRFSIKAPALKKFMAGSKVVDEAGEPIIVYHGTQDKTEFSEFDPQKGNSFGGWNGFGTWFSNKPEHANTFAALPQGGIGRVIPAYVSIKKPLNISFDGFQMLVSNLMKKTGGDQFTAAAGPVIKAHLQKNGYDGVIIKNFEGDGKPVQDMYVALESNQIKSASIDGNSGAFDPGNPNFRMSNRQRQGDLFEAGKGAVNAPNQKYIATVLAVHEGQQRVPKATDGMNTLVSKVVENIEARKTAEAQPVVEKPAAYTRADAERDTQALVDSMPGASIVILPTSKDAPDDVQAAMKRRNISSIAGITNPKNGQIILFADKIQDADDAIRLILHETFHAGARKAFGKDLDPLLADLYKNVPAKFKKGLADIIEGYKLDISKSKDRLEAAEELLAHIAEHDPQNSILENFVAKVRQLLRKAGIDMGTWTDQEIVLMIAEGQGAVGRGRDRIAGVTFDEDVVVDETGEIFTIEQDAEEILLQVDKRKAAVDRLKNCL